MTLSEVVVGNMALGHIGATRSLSSTDGTIALAVAEGGGESDDQRLVATFYAPTRDAMLRAFPWTFARKYVLLSEADDGDDEVWQDTFMSAYTYPSDCLQVRQFVQPEAGSRQWLPYNVIWEVRQHAGARVIMADVDPTVANIEYTAKPATIAGYPIDFDVALSWQLADALAAALKTDAALADRAAKRAYIHTSIAQRTDANESNRRSEPDGDFLRAHGAATLTGQLPFNGGLLT